MITQETISKVTEAINIVDVIGDYVKLKKRGANYIGISPFSNERTPSFTVSPVKNIYKCFSSGKSGNAVTFLMDNESMSYPEAIKMLCERYKIAFVEDKQDDATVELHKTSDTLYIANGIAAVYYKSALLASGVAMEYFTSRGVTLEDIEKWQLGYAGESMDLVANNLASDSLSIDTLIKADLCYRPERNPSFIQDKYIHRVLFPFHGLSGRINGFSGRTLKPDKSIPKYTNTSENEIFKKRTLLYGIFQARKAMQKQDCCNIVEGQVDVIAMHRNGFENTVATGGTAITKEHILIIKRFCKKIVFIYDGDEAGQKAISKGIELAIEEGMSVNILVLPTGEDPDSFLLNYGADEFTNYSKANTGDIIDFYMGDGKSISPEQKKLNGPILLRLIAIIGHHDIFRRYPKVKKLHSLFNADINKINAAIDAIKITSDQPEMVIDIFDNATDSGASVHEIEFTKTLLRYGHLPYNSDEELVYYSMLPSATPDFFKNPVTKIIIQDYWDCINSGNLPDQDRYINYPDTKVSEFATNLAFEDFEISKTWEGIDDLNVGYKPLVKSAISFFELSVIQYMIEDNELDIRGNYDEVKTEELMKKNKALKSSFRALAARNGISFFK